VKDSTSNTEVIDLQISKVVSKLLKSNLVGENSDKSASRGNTSGRKVEEVIEIDFLSRKYRDLLGYLILYHYYPTEDTVRAYMFLDLTDHIQRESESFWLSVLLDKELFLKWLEVQKTISSRMFFSSICNVRNLGNLQRSIVYQFEERLRRPKRAIRHKGYRDKGTLPDYSLKVLREELSNDYYISGEHWLLELRREIQTREETLLRDYLTEGGVLAEEFLFEFKILERM
jgi:hypothetical protein